MMSQSGSWRNIISLITSSSYTWTGGSAMASTYRTGRTPNSWMEGGSGNTFYVIYVKKADLERAKDICKSI